MTRTAAARIYEINNGKTLCHVFAGGRRIATFEPQGGGPWAKVAGKKNWYLASRDINSALSWPFRQGRTPFTITLATFCGLLGFCMVTRRKYADFGRDALPRVLADRQVGPTRLSELIRANQCTRRAANLTLAQLLDYEPFIAKESSSTSN